MALTEKQKIIGGSLMFLMDLSFVVNLCVFPAIEKYEIHWYFLLMMTFIKLFPYKATKIIKIRVVLIEKQSNEPNGFGKRITIN